MKQEQENCPVEGNDGISDLNHVFEDIELKEEVVQMLKKKGIRTLKKRLSIDYK